MFLGEFGELGHRTTCDGSSSSYFRSFHITPHPTPIFCYRTSTFFARSNPRDILTTQTGRMPVRDEMLP